MVVALVTFFYISLVSHLTIITFFFSTHNGTSGFKFAIIVKRGRREMPFRFSIMIFFFFFPFENPFQSTKLGIDYLSHTYSNNNTLMIFREVKPEFIFAHC